MKIMNKNNKLRGIGYMILNSFALSLIYILMKKLSVDLNSSQVVFFYKFCCLIIISPWVFNEGVQILKTPQLKLHILRGFFSASGSLFFLADRELLLLRALVVVHRPSSPFSLPSINHGNRRCRLFFCRCDCLF